MARDLLQPSHQHYVLQIRKLALSDGKGGHNLSAKYVNTDTKRERLHREAQGRVHYTWGNVRDRIVPTDL